MLIVVENIAFDLKKNVLWNIIILSPVVQTFDSAFYQTNHYRTNKYSGKQLRHALKRSLSKWIALER